MLHRGVFATLVPLLLVAAPPAARGYRDLAGCPDLTPLEPLRITTAAGRDCARAVARAGRKYVGRVLAAHAACFEAVQSGGVGGDPARSCRGLERLSNGVYDVPADADTAGRVADAEARFADDLQAACTDEGAAALEGCAPTAAGLAACVLAEQRTHALDVIDQQFGEVAPVPSEPARRCQRKLDGAVRAYVAKVDGAHEKCLRRHASRPETTHLATTCLGQIDQGIDVLPTDARTAAMLRRARARLKTRLSRACPDPSALDACATDGPGLARCLTCTARRETLLGVQARHGGVADRATTHFIDWRTLANPVFSAPDRPYKNQTIARADGAFWLAAGDGLRRTPDFRDYEDVVVSSNWSGDLHLLGDTWHQVSNSSVGEIFGRTSLDLVTWSARASITPGLFVNETIDGALTRHGDYVFLALKDRVQQLPYVTRSVRSSVDGAWLPPVRAVAGNLDVLGGFAEAYHFVTIDGRERIVATGRDPEPFRCPDHPTYFVYTCSHEPFIYTIPDTTDDLTTWVNWRHKTWLRVPYEAWNRIMHANSGQLADWRAFDGFFYLSYAGADDGESFDLRGHGKIGLARSRDLVHWRVPGDLRD